MNNFYAKTEIGNGYSCGCCRNTYTDNISTNSREEFIKEFYESWHYSEGDISLSYLRGITTEEIDILKINFKEMQKLVEEMDTLKYNYTQAKKHVEAVQSYIETVNLYPSKLDHLNDKITQLSQIIGKDSIPEDILGD